MAGTCEPLCGNPINADPFPKNLRRTPTSKTDAVMAAPASVANVA